MRHCCAMYETSCCRTKPKRDSDALALRDQRFRVVRRNAQRFALLEVFFDVAAFAAGIRSQPTGRTAVGAVDLVALFFVARERQVGATYRAIQIFDHGVSIGATAPALEPVATGPGSQWVAPSQPDVRS